jgi:hypothetical protein
MARAEATSRSCGYNFGLEILILLLRQHAMKKNEKTVQKLSWRGLQDVAKINAP